MEEREAANQALKIKGEFKDGIFTWYDESGKKHNQDGFEACFEAVMGRKLEYAKPRYEDLVLMNPASFDGFRKRRMASTRNGSARLPNAIRGSAS